MPASRMVTQRDQVKEPQFVVEGNTAATYGVTPTNPNFIAAGQDSRLIENSAPVLAKKRILGNVNNQETKKTREKNGVTLKTYFMNASEALLAWGMNTPNGAATPDESRTFVNSYSDENGTERFRQFKGCKPVRTTLSVDNDGFLVLEIVMTCKTITEDTTGPTLGAGSFATALTGTPLTHLDGGASNFTYNAVVTDHRGGEITAALTQASQDANGTLFDLNNRPTIRTISGNLDLFKISGTLQQDARDASQRAATWIINSGLITLTLTRMRLDPSSEETSGDTSDAVIERKPFEADDLVVS